MTALKFVDGSETAIEGLLLPFGGPAYLGGKDLSREYFSAKTDFCLDWYEGGVRPLLYHHGLRTTTRKDAPPDPGTTPIGKITSIEMKDDGGWMQAQLDEHGKYFAEISGLIKRGAVGLSSGAMAHLVETDAATGEVKRWPVVEGSTTPVPCNPLGIVDFQAVTKHYKSADITLPEQVKAGMTAEQRDSLDDGDFAYIDADGGKHLPIHDAAHVRAAIARFDQTTFEDDGARKQAARKILAAAKRLSIDVSPDSAVSEAAGAAAAKALMEGSDTAGGFAADGDGTAADRSQYAGQAHTESRVHAHAHADGAEHRHAHRHDAGDPSHDTGTHPHAVGVPMLGATPTKAAPASGGPDDGERSFEDIRDDIEGLLNPGGPVPATAYSRVVAIFPDRVVVCRCEQGDDDTYWRIAYTLGPDLEPVLGEAVQVDQVWVPRTPAKAATPLTLNALSASRQAAALAREAKALGLRRATDGRPLSAPNYHALAAAKAGLVDAAEQCAAVLATSDDRQQRQAKAAALESPEGLEVRLAILRLTAGLLPGHAA